VTTFDVARVRGLYPTVGGGVAHLDGPYGALHAETVIRAIIATLRSSPAQPGSASPRSKIAAEAVRQARQAVADLVLAAPDAVVLGASLASLMERFVVSLAQDWMLGDEIVVSRLDADAVLRPLLAVARAHGVVVRWAEVDLETGELPTWQYEHLVGRRTRAITVPVANAATGALVDVRTIADVAHRHGALVLADVAAALPHVVIDLPALGADLLGISAPAFGGPNVAALVARPGLLLELDSDDHRPIPYRFEFGPLPVELLGGLTAAIDHLACLDESATGTRRERLERSQRALAAHETALFDRLADGLAGLPRVTVLGSTPHRVPVAAFTVDGHQPAEVGRVLQRHRVSVWTGDGGLQALMTAFGADELGGAVHLGLAPHSTAVEVEQLLDGLEIVIKSR
jgi:cysteine desulfurase family protein (TIGR01976 family)